MHLLGLLSGGNLASTNSPDGLIGNDNLLPVIPRELGGKSSKLLLDNSNSVASLALLKGLAAAPNHAETTVNGSLGLVGDILVRLAAGSALRVAGDGPVQAEILKLGDRDLAGVGAVGLGVDVLGRDGDGAGGDGIDGDGEVEVGWGDDDLYGRD